uniref:Uncharacterized protein n=1 Tax=Octopus bimaculoides TaxID=37653 RepID=A0A0L8GF14_OCTBM
MKDTPLKALYPTEGTLSERFWVRILGKNTAPSTLCLGGHLNIPLKKKDPNTIIVINRNSCLQILYNRLKPLD